MPARQSEDAEPLSWLANNDPSGRVRTSAIYALRCMESPLVTDYLVSVAVAENRPPAERAAALLALAARNAPIADPEWAITLLHHPDPRIQFGAGRLIASKADPALIDTVVHRRDLPARALSGLGK